MKMSSVTAWTGSMTKNIIKHNKTSWKQTSKQSKYHKLWDDYGTVQNVSWCWNM